MNDSIWQSQTFKAVLLYFITMACNAVARRWGVELNPAEIAGLTTTIIAFIAGRQWKQKAMLDNGIHPMQVEQTEKDKVADVPKPIPEAAKAATSAGVLLLCAGILLTMPGCVHLNKPKLTSGLEQCASGFVSSEVQAALPDVLNAIQGKSADWQGQLDTVLLKAGTAGICALGVIIASLEGGTGGAAGAMPVVLQPPEAGGLPRAVVLLRAYTYTESRR